MLKGLEIGYYDTSSMWSYFDNLPQDEYTPGGFRFRRLGNFTSLWKNGPSFEQVSSSIMQPADVNSYLGDIERVYSPLEDELVESEDFYNMVMKFQDITGWLGDFSIHQIRITANEGSVAEPAPEGVHRDGYRWIVPFFANMQNIKGGAGQVYDKEGKELLVNIKAKPNCYMAFPDREMQHFGTPIKQKDESAGPGHWDSFVFAADIDE